MLPATRGVAAADADRVETIFVGWRRIRYLVPMQVIVQEGVE